MTTTEQRNQVKRIAVEFRRRLRSGLTKRQLGLVRSRNKAEGHDSSVCHSHDFCDANVHMAEAFKVVMGRECLLPMNEPGDAEIQADCDLMNAAWTLAKPRI